jgi:hypothetical protein
MLRLPWHPLIKSGKNIPLSQKALLCTNVFYHYLSQYHYLGHLYITQSQVRRQRQQQQESHSSTMWCISELDFMIISLRAKSKSNKKHSLKRVQRRRKSSFASSESCDWIFTNQIIVINIMWSQAREHKKFESAVTKQMYSLWRMLLIWFWLRSKRDNHKI